MSKSDYFYHNNNNNNNNQHPQISSNNNPKSSHSNHAIDHNDYGPTAATRRNRSRSRSRRSRSRSRRRGSNGGVNDMDRNSNLYLFDEDHFLKQEEEEEMIESGTAFLSMGVSAELRSRRSFGHYQDGVYSDEDDEETEDDDDDDDDDEEDVDGEGNDYYGNYHYDDYIQQQQQQQQQQRQQMPAQTGSLYAYVSSGYYQRSFANRRGSTGSIHRPTSNNGGGGGGGGGGGIGSSAVGIMGGRVPSSSETTISSLSADSRGMPTSPWGNQPQHQQKQQQHQRLLMQQQQQQQQLQLAEIPNNYSEESYHANLRSYRSDIPLQQQQQQQQQRQSAGEKPTSRGNRGRWNTSPWTHFTSRGHGGGVDSGGVVAEKETSPTTTKAAVTTTTTIAATATATATTNTNDSNNNHNPNGDMATWGDMSKTTTNNKNNSTDVIGTSNMEWPPPIGQVPSGSTTVKAGVGENHHHHHHPMGQSGSSTSVGDDDDHHRRHHNGQNKVGYSSSDRRRRRRSQSRSRSAKRSNLEGDDTGVVRKDDAGAGGGPYDDDNRLRRRSVSRSRQTMTATSNNSNNHNDSVIEEPKQDTQKERRRRTRSVSGSRRRDNGSGDARSDDKDRTTATTTTTVPDVRDKGRTHSGSAARAKSSGRDQTVDGSGESGYDKRRSKSQSRREKAGQERRSHSSGEVGGRRSVPRSRMDSTDQKEGHRRRRASVGLESSVFGAEDGARRSMSVSRGRRDSTDQGGEEHRRRDRRRSLSIGRNRTHPSMVDEMEETRHERSCSISRNREHLLGIRERPKSRTRSRSKSVGGKDKSTSRRRPSITSHSSSKQSTSSLSAHSPPLVSGGNKKLSSKFARSGGVSTNESVSIGACYRSEALEELTSNILDTLEGLEGRGFKKSRLFDKDRTRTSKNVRVLVAEEDVFGPNNNNSTDEHGNHQSDDDEDSPVPRCTRLCKKVVRSFRRLLVSLLRLSDELELSSTFRSLDSIGGVVSAHAVNGVLTYVPMIDLIFSEIQPTLVSLYESAVESSALGGGDEESDVDGDTADIRMRRLLKRSAKLVKVITGLVEKVRKRQEWNARSETCFVTLLELLKRASHELHCLDEDEKPVEWAVSSKLRRAWTASGHTDELKALYMCQSEEDLWLYRQVCYEVIITTDTWCPDVEELKIACDCEVHGAERTDTASSVRGMRATPDEQGGEQTLAETPTAALEILAKIRYEPLPREVTMGRIVRKVLPPNETSNLGIINEKITSVRCSILNPARSNGETNLVTISAGPEIKNDPTSLGMGGVGKTTLAAMLTARNDVRRFYKDGIAWVYIGSRPDVDMTYEFYVTCLMEICRQLPFLREMPPIFHKLIDIPCEKPLTREQRKTSFMVEAKNKMSNALQSRNVLIVLDDVTFESDVEWFQFNGSVQENCNTLNPITIIVTTRVRDLLPFANTVEIDLLEGDEAIQLLVTESGHPPHHVMGSSIEAKAVVRDCANHPLAVKSVGRWLSLKHATSGVINSVEEVHEDVAKSIEKIARNGDFFAGNMMYEIMNISFSPAVNEKPTQVIQLCFAAYVKVFCQEEELIPDPTTSSPVIPVEIAVILFGSLLHLEKERLIEEGSLAYGQLREAVTLIPEALSALDVFRIIYEKREQIGEHPEENNVQKFIQLQHDIQQEYGEYLISEGGGLGDMTRDCDRRWNEAFVIAYVETKSDSHWDDAEPDACRRYALQMIVSHMIRGEMFKEAASLLTDESFIRGRLSAIGIEKGTKRHIRDCEDLLRKVLEVKLRKVLEVKRVDKSILAPNNVMENAFETVDSVLKEMVDGATVNERKAASVKAGRAYYSIGFSFAERRSWRQAIKHWETAQELLAAVLGNVELVAAIRYNVGVVYFEMNQFEKALNSLKECLQIRNSVHGEKHTLCAQTIQKIGDIYLEMSDNVEAMESYRKARDMMNRESKSNRIDIGNILHSIGCIHYSRGELDEAMKCFEESLYSLKTELGENHPDLATTYQRLGTCLSDRGEIGAAVAQLEESIHLKELDRNGGDENCSDILSIEGMLHNLLGRQDECLKCYEKALSILRSKVPHKREKIANMLHLIGCVYLVKNEHKKAMKRFEESLQTRSKMLGFVHSDVASTLFNMAFLHQTRNKFSKALKCLEEALRIRKLRLPNSDKVALTYEKIGSLCKFIGKYKKAELAFEEALKIRKLVHGEDHEAVASLLHEMGDLMDDIGEYDEAISCFTDALDIRRRKLGERHELVASTLYSMGFTLHNEDMDHKALLCFEEALNIRKARLGKDAAEVGDTLNIMGFLHAKRGELSDSLALLWDALRIRKLDGNKIKASDTLKNIGNVHREQQETELAIECYEECLRIRKTELGNDHEKVADVLVALGNIKSDMHDRDGAMKTYEEALRILRMIYGDIDEKLAPILQNMGMLEFKEGDLHKSKQLLEEYIRVKNTNETELDADYVNVMFIVGNISKIHGDTEEARRYWTEAYKIYNQIGLEEENPHIREVMENMLKGRSMDPMGYRTGLVRRMSSWLQDEKVSKGKSSTFGSPS